MSGAILRLFGFDVSVPQRESSVPPSRLAEAEDNFNRSIMAHTLACASASHEAVRCNQKGAELREAMHPFTDRRKTEPCCIPDLACSKCEHREEVA